ncbi:MAG TPA: right-handed parallel beta-helix repeat-containing protein [Thermoanaerobaculia bacterium]
MSAAASLGAARAATTYYVSPSGSDGNPGTSVSPFRQIRKGIAVGTAGDTVLVADGSYLGFDLSITGTPSAPFTIKATGSAANVLPTTDRSDNRDTIHILFSSYVVVDGLTSFNANRAAVRIDQADHVTVRNGVFGNNATWGIFTDFSDDLLLENNECYASGTQHGIYVSNSGDRPVVRGNRVHDNAGCGIQLNADLSQGGDGLITGAVIENNLAWNNGAAGGAAINLDGVQSSIVRNNLLYNNHASGIACFQIDGAAGPTGMSILNNTVDMASNGRWALLIKSSTGPNVVRNNILYDQNAGRGGIDYGDATDVANTDSDYNIMDAVTPDDSTRVTLANWQLAGHEPHSFSATPAVLFVNEAGADYHLKAGSPAIDAGQIQASVPTDLEGRARPIGPAYDIGCYEFAAASGMSFFALPPCRIVDTRNGSGPLGGPALVAGARRTFTLTGGCGIPATARSLSLNVTVTAPTASGDLKLFAGGTATPTSTTINYGPGQTRANNAQPALGGSGNLAVQCDQASGSVQLIIDVNGYFQ